MAISESSVIGFRGHVRRLRRMRRRARMHTMARLSAPQSAPKHEKKQAETHFLVRQIRKQAAQLVIQRAAHVAT